ncbi:MAG: serine hydrolase domain-containing protein [Vicinamibacterales bacterium]
MRHLRIRVTALSVAAFLFATAVAPAANAQSLTFGLFERYLDALRLELNIPGLSAAVVQNGKIVWDHGFGSRDVAASLAAAADTPYPVANLSETFGAALVLQQCIDRGDEIALNDRVVRWTTFPEPTTTIAQVLAHVNASNVYQYDTTRFGSMSGVVVECVDQPYPRIMATEVLDRLAMTDSVPGRDVVEAPGSQVFPAVTLDRYRGVLTRMAAPYRVDSKGAAIRSDYTQRSLTGSNGLISTVRDLAKFDTALADGILLSPESRAAMWAPGSSRPTGLGWFVQSYNGERLIWHFGLAKDAYSSLIVKVPGRQLTLILLANSDGLATSFTPTAGDVTQSIFARLFLTLFIS